MFLHPPGGTRRQPIRAVFLLFLLAAGSHGWAGRGRPSKAQAGRGRQGQAYQARLDQVRGRLQARLPEAASAPAAGARRPPSRPVSACPPRWTRLLFLLMALLSAVQGGEAGQVPVPPAQPAWDPGAWAWLPPAPEEAPATLCHAVRLARGADLRDPRNAGDWASLEARLAGFEHWSLRTASEARRRGDRDQALPLDALAGLAQDLRSLAGAGRTGQVSPAGAQALTALAGAGVLDVAAGLWIGAQTEALAVIPPSLERVQARMDRARAQNRTGSGAPRMAPPLRVPQAWREAREACCDYFDLLAQAGLRQVQAAGGAASVAGTVLFLEASATGLGVDLQALGNLTWTEPDPALLAVPPATPAAAAALAGGAVAPASAPAGPWPDPAVAARCASFACDDPLLALQVRSARAFLAADLTFVAASTLYLTSAQIGLAAAGTRGAPDPDPMGPLRRAAAAPAAPGAAPGPADPGLLAEGLEALARNLERLGRPAPDASQDDLARDLAGLRDQLTALSARRAEAAPGTATPASALAWQRIDRLAECAQRALDAHRAWRRGALEPAAAAALLAVAADTVELVGLGLFMVPSAAPLVLRDAWLEAARPALAKARARALGTPLPEPGGPGCKACCALADLRNQEAALRLGWEAGRANLAAYVTSAVGAGIGTGLAVADLVQAAPDAPAAGAVTPQSVPDPDDEAARCAGCPCDTRLSAWGVTEGEDLLTAARLNLAGTTLFLVLRGLRAGALLAQEAGQAMAHP